jgi:hypothetical protein
VNGAAVPIVDANPFAALTLIVAPAVLTNASSVLVLSTSNRFARAIDRARVLAQTLEKPAATADAALTELRMRQLGRLERRSLMLLMAMRLFYLSLGSFASATLVSVIGAVMASAGQRLILQAVEVVAAVAGIFGVGGLVFGSAFLVRDTRLAVLNLSEEGDMLRARLARPTGARPPLPDTAGEG